MTAAQPGVDLAEFAWHLAGLTLAVAVLVFIVWLIRDTHRRRPTQPHIPADVDLPRCVANVRAIDETRGPRAKARA